MYASEYGMIDITDVLLSKGAKPEIRDFTENTGESRKEHAKLHTDT